MIRHARLLTAQDLPHTHAAADQTTDSHMSSVLHIYLSPHLDDAILSCGGLICKQRQADERVGVLTLCAGLPKSSYRSPLAKQYERSWGSQGEGNARRLWENSAVLSALGVKDWRFDTPDAIYRGTCDTPYYKKRENLFESPHLDERICLPTLWGKGIQVLCAQEKTVVVYAPLAVGGHVDHELVRRTAEKLWKTGCEVWFYEDYPYVEVFPAAIHSAKERFPNCDWFSRVEMIDAATKIGWVRRYQSQIKNLFGCENELARRVLAFTSATAAAVDHNEALRSKRSLIKWWQRWWRSQSDVHRQAERFWQPRRKTEGLVQQRTGSP